ncbi:MAG: HAD hydrolase-like protein [Actinobacteria bacterium]|nr:HAD hydrolase-like protein [Actinomycetota bacterium]
MVDRPIGRADIAGYRGILCDLDGVVLRGGRLLDGAVRFAEIVADLGVPLVFVTNGSWPKEQVVGELAAAGWSIEPHDIVNSGDSIALEAKGSNQPLVAAGGPGLPVALAAAGIVVAAPEEFPLTGVSGPIVYAVTGEQLFSYESLTWIYRLVDAGLELLFPSDERYFPLADGLGPGGGPFLAALREMVPGARVRICGKPHPPMVAAVGNRLGGEGPFLMIGDNPDVDLVFAHANGWDCLLVATGAGTPERIAASTARFTAAGLAAVADTLEA